MRLVARSFSLSFALAIALSSGLSFSAFAGTVERIVYPLKCSGNEPFWSISFDEERAGLIWLGEGDQPLAYSGGGSILDWHQPPILVWRGQSEDADGNPAGGSPGEGELVIFVRAEQCFDTMSGRVSPLSIVASVPDGQVLVGCCRTDLSQITAGLSDLAGRTWQLTHINDTPASHPVTLQVSTENPESLRFVGSTGCNRYFTAVSSENPSELNIGDIGMTRRLCPEVERNELELKYITELGQMNRWQMTGSGELLLEGEGSSLRFIEAVEQVEGM